MPHVSACRIVAERETFVLVAIPRDQLIAAGPAKLEPSMSPQEQEARSRVHDERGIKVIQLRDGTFALFDQWSRLIDLGIHYENLHAKVLYRLETWDFTMRRPAPAPAASGADLLEELGL